MKQIAIVLSCAAVSLFIGTAQAQPMKDGMKKDEMKK